MFIKSRAVRLVVAVTLFASFGALVGVADASAASAPIAPASASVPPPGPSGCNSGSFCSYNGAGGTDLCFQTTATTNFPPGCAGENVGAFNNTSVNVELYKGSGETEAYYLLGPGDYLLTMSSNDFNHCPGGGTSCVGYGKPMGDNVNSVYIPT
jgi:hypothetical protein